jgi:hypothetical protein
MAPKAKDANATLPQQPQEELDEETPDIMPDRTLTAEEAEQETECNNDRRSSDSLLEDGAAVEKNAIR